MNPCVAQFGEENIPGDNDLFRGSGPPGQSEYGAPVPFVHHSAPDHVVLLAMIHDREVEHARVLGRPAHHLVVLNAVAIVRNGDNAGLHHRSDRRHFLAFEALRYSAGREDIDQRGFARPIGAAACVPVSMVSL
jgi:hypothetical protein